MGSEWTHLGIWYKSEFAQSWSTRILFTQLSFSTGHVSHVTRISFRDQTTSSYLSYRNCLASLTGRPNSSSEKNLYQGSFSKSMSSGFMRPV